MYNNGYIDKPKAMKLFGCSFGQNLDGIDKTFYHDAYDYMIYFIADPVHMLKL